MALTKNKNVKHSYKAYAKILNELRLFLVRVFGPFPLLHFREVVAE